MYGMKEIRYEDKYKENKNHSSDLRNKKVYIKVVEEVAEQVNEFNIWA